MVERIRSQHCSVKQKNAERKVKKKLFFFKQKKIFKVKIPSLFQFGLEQDFNPQSPGY